MSPLILAALLHAAPAQTYPVDWCDVPPFTRSTNYMSLRGSLTLRFQGGGGRWISPQEARRAAESYLAACPTPTATGTSGPAPFTPATNFMSMRGFERLQRQPTAKARP